MSDIQIHALSDKPQYTDACVAWAFGEWGCLRDNAKIDLAERWFIQKQPETGEVLLTWIAMAGDKIAGMASIDYEDHEDHKDLTPWLANVFVHPHFRGRGIASKLIEYIKTEAKKMKYPHLYLFTPDAMPLYAKHGWKEVGKVRDPVGLNEHDILMKIDL